MQCSSRRVVTSPLTVSEIRPGREAFCTKVLARKQVVANTVSKMSSIECTAAEPGPVGLGLASSKISRCFAVCDWCSFHKHKKLPSVPESAL